MNKDFAPLAVEGVDPWDSVEIEPNVRRLAERAADAAGLSVEEWLERAIRRTCALGLPPAANTPVRKADAGMTGLLDQGETTLAAAPVGRWAIDIGPEIPPPATDDGATRDAMAQGQAQPAVGDESRNRGSVNAVATNAPAATPAAAKPPSKANASWTIIERLAQQQTTRHTPVRLVRKDLEAPAEPPAETPPTATRPAANPFVQAALSAQDTDEATWFEDPFPAEEDFPGMVKRPLVRRTRYRSGAPQQARSAGWRQWLLMGVSCLLALTAGMFLAPLIFQSGAPVQTSRQVTVDLTPPAPAQPARPVVETPANEPPVIPPPAQTAPPATIAVPETPPPVSPPPQAAETAKPATPTPVPPVAAKAENSGGHDSADSAAPPAVPPTAAVTSHKMAMVKPPAEPTPPKPDAVQSPKQKASEPDPGTGDPKKLAAWLDARAKNGDAPSQYRLGVLYVQGQGVPQDYERAGTLFRAAAEAGVAEAEYNVAVMYNEGMGMPRDLKQAVFWYQKAAAQGNANAAFNLGVAYANGSGVEQNMEEAARWFRRAGSQGVTNAQFNLALLYERGEGVPVSQVEAYAWYAAAAAHGDTGAAQRRDHLAGTMSPSELKQAKTRAAMLQQSVQEPGKDATATAKP